MSDNARMVKSAIDRGLDDAFRHIELNRDATIYEISDIVRYRYGPTMAWEWGDWAAKQDVEDSSYDR